MLKVFSLVNEIAERSDELYKMGVVAIDRSFSSGEHHYVHCTESFFVDILDGQTPFSESLRVNSDYPYKWQFKKDGVVYFAILTEKQRDKNISDGYAPTKVDE